MEAGRPVWGSGAHAAEVGAGMGEREAGAPLIEGSTGSPRNNPACSACIMPRMMTACFLQSMYCLILPRTYRPIPLVPPHIPACAAPYPRLLVPPDVPAARVCI